MVGTAEPRRTTGRGQVLAALALAQFICSFAGSNMNVMINDISEDLDTSVQGVQVAITVFLLVMAAFMIPGGKLTDRFGRKRCFLTGLVVYAIGALLSAVAPGLGVLILGNSILEGIGTALLIPPVYILATLLYPEVTSRARAFGVIMALGGIGAAAGPLIGGLITTGISWRAAFVFQALVIAVIVVLSLRMDDPLPADPTRTFDVFGAVLSAAGLILVVMGILAADDNVWLMIALLLLGAAVLLWFFQTVRAKEAAGKEPLLSLSLFANRTSNLGLITQNVQWLMLMGTSFTVAAYLQVVRHYDAIETGVVFTAATLGLLLTSLAHAHHDRLRRVHGRRGRPDHPGRRLLDRLGVRPRTPADRTGPGRDADPVRQRRAVELPGGAPGRDLWPLPQRLEPRLLLRHRHRRHHPGLRPHQGRLRRRDDHAGRPEPHRPHRGSAPARTDRGTVERIWRAADRLSCDRSTR